MLGVMPRRKIPPWISPDLQLLLDERDATHRKYQREGRQSILQKFLRLSELSESRVAAARCAYMKNLGLLPSSTSALHGFTSEELDSHFSNISISPSEDPNDLLSMISTAPEAGFAFSPVTTNDVILVVAHFKSKHFLSFAMI